MKKWILLVVILIIGVFTISSFSYGSRVSSQEEIKYDRESLYLIVIDKKVDFKNDKMLEVLSNWYSYFDKEEMFLTQDGEYIDYTTYEIYRVHLENIYKDDKKKITKYLLRYGNYPKQENSENYDTYINEYKRTTGKDI